MRENVPQGFHLRGIQLADALIPLRAHKSKIAQIRFQSPYNYS
ncbi:hypothetical protein [Sphingorhabdus sp.]